ncbi:MAG: LD-carboxypeptidase [Chloroflexota bacterium]|nr:LD-carboxypeptidase [Chloroflexota bacterium]
MVNAPFADNRRSGNILAPALKPGDTIGVVSPSWFGGEAFVPRAQRGMAQLQRLGFRVTVAEHAFNNHGHVSDTAENRVADLRAMFADPEIRMILATIGGDHSCHLLPLIDWQLIRDNPKIFMGFSDITVLNVAIWSQTGLVTFNGPGLLTDWAEFPEMPAFSRENAIRAIRTAEPMGELAPSGWWTEEFLDWSTGEDALRPRRQEPSTGWRWLRAGSAQAPLIGGCLKSMQHLRGTPYWPDLTGAILFLETSEEKPSPEDIDGILMDYENMGVFEQIAGLIVARPYGYSDAEKVRLHDIIVERTATFGFPVLADTDTGHTTPLQTLPIGCTALLDSVANRFAITEAAVR